jgi:hypothetical protein
MGRGGLRDREIFDNYSKMTALPGFVRLLFIKRMYRCPMGMMDRAAAATKACNNCYETVT